MYGEPLGTVTATGILFDPLEFAAARDCAGRLAEERARAAGCRLKRHYDPAPARKRACFGESAD